MLVTSVAYRSRQQSTTARVVTRDEDERTSEDVTSCAAGSASLDNDLEGTKRDEVCQIDRS